VSIKEDSTAVYFFYFDDIEHKKQGQIKEMLADLDLRPRDQMLLQLMKNI